MPANRKPLVEQISNRRETTVLFLMNFTRHELHGVFLASGPAGFPLHNRAWVPGAWDHQRGCEADSPPMRAARAPRSKATPYPAQLPVRRLGPPLEPLGEAVYRPVMKYFAPQKFELELGSSQVEQLVTLLVRQTQQKDQAGASNVSPARAGNKRAKLR